VDEPPDRREDHHKEQEQMALQDTEAVQRLKKILDRLMDNEEEYDEFEEAPADYLARHGLEDISAEDVASCMPEQYQLPEAVQVEYTAKAHAAASASASASAHASAMAEAVSQITYHHNYYYDESTNVFNSIEVGDIYAEGDVDLDFDQDLNAATGDEAVAIDDSIVDGPVNTGDHSVVLDDTTVDDSSFNTGEFNGIQESGDGDVWANGSAVGEGNSVDNSVEYHDSFNTDNSIDNSVDYQDSFNTDQSVEYHDSFNTDYHDSFNTDNSIDTEYHDSFNTDSSVDNSIDTEYHDSFNTDSSVDNSSDDDGLDLDGDVDLDFDVSV
jgi:hypothetical protein